MKRWGEQKPLHLDEREMKTDLGRGNFIFVGSSCDMFAKDVQGADICLVLAKISNRGGENKYLFQTKNPARFYDFIGSLPSDFIVCTTLESSRNYPEYMGHTPAIVERADAMRSLHKKGVKTMVTVEPIMDFDTPYFVKLIKETGAFQVNIGADSGHNRLPEPSPDKVQDLIQALEMETTVKMKPNLKRVFWR
jgi:DNA repair photolyase